MDPPILDVVPISAIEHYAYCPRQCALIHVDGVWSDNVHTVQGSIGHQRVDSGANRRERDRLVLRTVPLWSEPHGLTGRADAVEIERDGTIVPVEYKIGVPHGQVAHLQLCAQALCLEVMTGRRIDHGALWFSVPRRRIRVQFDAALRQATLDAIDQVRGVLADRHLPMAPDDERCANCQLIGHCLPGIVARPEVIDRYLDEVVECGT